MRFLLGHTTPRFPPLTLIAWMLSGWLFLQGVQAAQLQSVQSGATTIGTSATFTEVTITAVDTSRAFLVFGTRLDENQPDYSQISGQLQNATTLRFERPISGATNDVTIRWYVAEFVSGVTVHRGNIAIDQTTKDVTLPSSVDTAKSFPIISFRKAGGGYDGDDFVRAEIVEDTLRFEAHRIPSVTGFGVVEWQVVEYADAAVQTGTVVFGTSDSSQTATISSVDTGKSWLIYTFESENGTNTNIAQKLVRGLITNDTTLTFDRDSTGQVVDLTWYLVEFTDGTTVQHGSQSFNASDTARNINLTSIDPAWTIAAGGYFIRGGKSPYSADDNPGVGWFTFDVSSETQLVIERDVNQATADVGWFVIQFIGNVTAVDLAAFTAAPYNGGVLLQWQTGYDMDILGWHVYREMQGKPVKLTPGMIAGSALTFGPGIRLNNGNTYRWWDPAGQHTDRYWIEDRNLRGQRTKHGPVTPVMTDQPPPSKWPSPFLSQVLRKQTSWAKARDTRQMRSARHRIQRPDAPIVTSTQRRPPWEGTALSPPDAQHALAAAPAVQILIRETGWYRVPQPDLIRAGLDAAVDPRRPQLFVEGQPQPSVAPERRQRRDPLANRCCRRGERGRCHTLDVLARVRGGR